MTQFEIFIYALLWLGFGLLHSLLARNWVKRMLQPFLGRKYRVDRSQAIRWTINPPLE